MEVGCAAIEAFQGMPFPGSFLNPRNLARFSFNLSIPFSLESTVHWTPTTCFTRYFLFFTSLIVRVETKYHFQRYSYIYIYIWLLLKLEINRTKNCYRWYWFFFLVLNDFLPSVITKLINYLSLTRN